MRFTNILLFCVLCFYEAKSSTEESFEVSSESIEDISNESGSSITFEEESEDVSDVNGSNATSDISTEESQVTSGESNSESKSNESGSSISFEEESEDVSDVSDYSTFDTSTDDSLEVSSGSIEDDENGSHISFELQSGEESEDVSDISNDSSDASFSSEITKNGVIDNDQVYCSWEDVDGRDEMATKLGTQLCRFSMFHESKYEGGPNVTMFCTYKPKSCKLSEITKEKHQARVWPVVAFAGFMVLSLGAIAINHELGKRNMNLLGTISPLGMNDKHFYCIPNDWRSRDRKAEEFRTLTNCIFSLPMVLAKKIPFGTMYCTYTQSYCTKLGLSLDTEQIAWNSIKASTNKGLIRAKNEIEDESGSSISFELFESE